MSPDGRIGRVRSIDTDLGRVFVDYGNGISSWFVPDDLDEWDRGDIAFVTETYSEKVDPSLWVKGHDVAEVKSVRDGEVLVTIDGKHQNYLQRETNPFEVGQVVRVELNGELGPVVGDEPIGNITITHNHDDFDVADLMVDEDKIATITLDMVGGAESLKKRALNLVRVALDPKDRIGQIGVKPVKGILFTGPSGTGKTYLAKALASEAGAKFYDISGPVIAGELVGQAERRLRDLFTHAVENRPAILFFDEIDSLFNQRGDGSNQHTNRLVGQFLAQLDGFTEYPQVLVIATTNLPEALDPALLRPGRLSHKIVFNLPDDSDRFQILKVQATGAQIANREAVDLDELVDLTPGWTAADLAAIWTEAGVLASLDKRTVLIKEDIIAAIGEVQRIQTQTGDEEGLR